LAVEKPDLSPPRAGFRTADMWGEGSGGERGEDGGKREVGEE